MWPDPAKGLFKVGTLNPKTFESRDFSRVNDFSRIRIFFRLRSAAFFKNFFLFFYYYVFLKLTSHLSYLSSIYLRNMKARFVRIDRKIEIAENAKSSSKKLDLWANSGKVQHADFQSLCTCSESSLTNPIRRVGRESISYLECSFLTAHCLTKVRFRPRQRPWVRGLLRVRNEFSMIYAQNIGSEQRSRYLVLIIRSTVRPLGMRMQIMIILEM